MSVECPICGIKTSEAVVNLHLDQGCPETKKAKKEESLSQKSSQPEIAKVEEAPQASVPVSKPTRLGPLAERMRPKELSEYVGQTHLLGNQGVLTQLLIMDKLPSLILWGPSGVGKTTFARLLAQITKARFIELSATNASVNDVKKVVSEAQNDLKLLKRKTILFLDEVHRFNRAQQDSLLPGIEKGDITLVGATTENPSFKLQGALLSRCRVFVLEPLTHENIVTLLERAIEEENSCVGAEVLSYIAGSASGDARAALSMLEIVLSLPDKSMAAVKPALRHAMLYDQKGDMHYDLISAFHKSVRGSDPDATLYYLARMLEAGEDPLYVARRMVRIASEDVGLADDTCLPFAVSAYTAAQQLGMPEADVILAHCAVKLARAPKSVDVYKAYKKLAAQLHSDPLMSGASVPLHLRNAPTKLMGDIGYGKAYKYNPDYEGHVNQEYLPEGLPERKWLGTHKAVLRDDSSGKH